MDRARKLTLVVLVCTLAMGARAAVTDLCELEAGKGRFVRSVNGVVADAYDLRIGLASSSPAAAARQLVESGSGLLYPAEEHIDLEVEDVRESLTGIHVRMRQTIGGVEVIGGGFEATFHSDGSLARFHNRIAASPAWMPAAREDRDWIARLVEVAPATSGRPVLDNRFVWVNISGRARAAQRIVVGTSAVETHAWYLDRATGDLLWTEPLFYTASTRIFDSNPVTRLNDPTLRDENDSAAAVPDGAYSLVELDDVPGAGTLRGPHVEIVDVEAPTTLRADLAKSLVFDREADEFEEVMAYFQIDRSKRYIESLGFNGSREVLGRPLKVDAHAVAGADNSFYRTFAGEGMLFFGDGGVDDAEDPDILLHEFGHAIHEGISRGAFGGSSATESRAMSEGFGDYWAFSQGYAASLASGRDPFCVGDWDARCGGGNSDRCGYPSGADCLRRVDGTMTIADFVRSNQAGTEHHNGQLWSSALREIFESLVDSFGVEEGRRISDTIVLESIFGLPTTSTFSLVAQQMLDADEVLYQGANRGRICTAMVSRGILEADLCGEGPRGEFILFQGFDTEVPFNSATGAVLTTRVEETLAIREIRVRVDIRHPRRGDLRLVLENPEGLRVVLKTESADVSPDLTATFGLDMQPAQSLATFLQRPGNGAWKLIVTDSGATGGGEVISWDLLLSFGELGPIVERGLSSESSRIIPAVAHAEGAERTNFVSDVRLFNGSGETRIVTAFFTHSRSNGLEQFAAIRISLGPGQSVALDDVVAKEFRTTGLGSLEFRGNLDGIDITSRTYNDDEDGTFGQFIPSFDQSESFAFGDEPVHITQLQNSARFRSNVGIAETTGKSGIVKVRVFDGEGKEIDSIDQPIEPFGHAQFPILGGPTGAVWHRVRVTVSVVEGAARIIAYGSVVDNVTGDPIFIPSRRDPAKSGPTRIPAVAHTSGGFRTEWRSDVWLANVSKEARLITVIYYPGEGMQPRLFDQLVEAGRMVAISDVLFTRFGVTQGLGEMEVVPGGVIVTSRTWTVKGEGGYGQFIPAVSPDDALGDGDGVVRAIGIANNGAYRTNIGIAEMSGASATVRIRILDAAGREVVSLPVIVGPNSLFQVGARQLGAPSLSNGVVELEVVGGDGRIAGYASIIDNKSGDPTFVPAR